MSKGTGFSKIDRRQLLQGAAAIGAVAGAGLSGTVASAAASLDVVMVNAAIGGPLRAAMESASAALADGALVGIFPEGKCAKPGEVLAYRPGVAVLSKDTGVPIIPVRLVNANKVLPLDRKLPSFGHTVYVLFGEPIHPDEFDSVPALLDEVQLRISTLT